MCKQRMLIIAVKHMFWIVMWNICLHWSRLRVCRIRKFPKPHLHKHQWVQPKRTRKQIPDPGNWTVNSLGPSDAIWRCRSGSTLARVMACCLTASSHYLNQCWQIISKVHTHSYRGNLTLDALAINHQYYFENHLSKFSFKSPRGQWALMLMTYFATGIYFVNISKYCLNILCSGGIHGMGCNRRILINRCHITKLRFWQLAHQNKPMLLFLVGYHPGI